MSKISSFTDIEKKHDVYRCKYYMKKCCKSLREHAMQIISFKSKKMKLLSNERQESYENTNICCICKEIFEDK